MLGFLNLFTAMSLRYSVKRQATIQQIQNAEFASDFILLPTFNTWNWYKSIHS